MMETKYLNVIKLFLNKIMSAAYLKTTFKKQSSSSISRG